MSQAARPPVELWRDISRPLSAATRVWPGDRAFTLDQRREGEWTISALTTSCHVGTHLDTPRHVDPAAPGLEDVPIDRLIGPAEVVHARSGASLIGRADLPEDWVPFAARVLIRTDSYPLDVPVDGGFAALHPELVEFVAGRGVEVIGIDTPSVDPFDSVDHPCHRALAAHGLVWLENLLLDGVEPGLYVLAALPLALVGAEAAPVRAVLRPVTPGAGGER